jgi:hypothetical protein
VAIPLLIFTRLVSAGARVGRVWERQLLGQRFAGPVTGVVEAVAGLNAQTPRGPSVGLWTRMVQFRQSELDSLLWSYELVKANLLRGTVHLVTRRQYGTWRAALQPVLEKAVRQFCPRLQADRDEVIRCRTQLLGESAGLTRAEIGQRLAAAFPDADPKDLGFAVRMLVPDPQLTPWRRLTAAERAEFDRFRGWYAGAG